MIYLINVGESVDIYVHNYQSNSPSWKPTDTSSSSVLKIFLIAEYAQAGRGILFLPK